MHRRGIEMFFRGSGLDGGSDQLQHGTAEDKNILRVHGEPAATGHRMTIDTHDILLGEVGNVPTGGVQVKTGVFARDGWIHQDDIVAQGAANGGTGLHEQVYQLLFWQPARGIFILELGSDVGR